MKDDLDLCLLKVLFLKLTKINDTNLETTSFIFHVLKHVKFIIKSIISIIKKNEKCRKVPSFIFGIFMVTAILKTLVLVELHKFRGVTMIQTSITTATFGEQNQDRDQRLIYSGLTWEQFKLIQAGFANSTGVRFFYYQGTIEIIMPGRAHETVSRFIGFLISLFCLESNIEFEPTGSMTQQREGEVSVEPDESYCFGTSKPIPDLVIEVIFTSGSPKKLQRYQALEIPEVWFWQDGVFSLYRLRDRNYDAISASGIPELAALDMDLLTRCVLIAKTSRLEAANTFQNAIAKQIA